MKTLFCIYANKISYRTKTICSLFLIVLLTFLCFMPSLSNELLIWDDFGYINENHHIRNLSFDTIVWAFSNFFANSWFPLTWLSFALDYLFWGTNPVGYHLTNNIFHALNAGLFFLLSLRLFERYQKEFRCNVLFPTRESLIYCALLASCFFALHPLRVESVAWAAERKDVLSLFFGISALLAYLHYTKTKGVDTDKLASFFSSHYYWIMMAAFCLSMLCKPMFVTLPVLLLILDWFPLKRFATIQPLFLVVEKVPLILYSSVISVITSLSQGEIIASHSEITMYSRVLNAFKSIIFYLYLTIWPVRINPLYLHPGNIDTLHFEHVASILLFIIITACCAISVKRYPLIMAVWLIYLTTLIPVLGLVQVGPQAMAARYTYLPALPISLLTAVGVMALYVKSQRIILARAILISSVFLMILLSIYTTIQNIAYWKDDVTLWTRSIELNTVPAGRAYFQRAHGYIVKGEYEKALLDLNEAVSIAISKGYREMHTIYVDRARVLKHLGDFEGAIADYTRCIQTDSSSKRIVYYQERGNIYRELGRYDLANEDFNKTAASSRQ